jgi:hypothetical protein
MRRERKDHLDLVLITAKAWNAWIQGQPIQALRLSEADRASEGFPVIREAERASLAAQGTKAPG